MEEGVLYVGRTNLKIHEGVQGSQKEIGFPGSRMSLCWWRLLQGDLAGERKCDSGEGGAGKGESTLRPDLQRDRKGRKLLERKKKRGTIPT